MNDAAKNLLSFNMGHTSNSNRRALSPAPSRIGVVKAQIRRVCTLQNELLAIGQGLISFAEHAYAFRNMALLAEVSEQMSSIPGLYMVGLYYKAITIKNKGSVSDAEGMLIKVAEAAPLDVRARALQTLGTLYHERGGIDTALRFYKEAMHLASTANEVPPITMLWTLGNLSALKSSEGDHRAALVDLENLYPLVRLASARNPYVYYDYHHNVAAELISLGKVAEARQASQIAINSAYAPAYPAWHETEQEIASYERKKVLVPVSEATSASPTNIIRLGSTTGRPIAHGSPQQASDVKGDLLKWRPAGKRENRSSLRARISVSTEDDEQVIFDDSINEKQLNRLLELAETFTRTKKA